MAHVIAGFLIWKSTMTKQRKNTPQHANFADLPDDAYARQPQTLEVVPFSPATLWRKVGEGSFPAPVKLSARVTAWRVGDVRKWLASVAQA